MLCVCCLTPNRVDLSMVEEAPSRAGVYWGRACAHLQIHIQLERSDSRVRVEMASTIRVLLNCPLFLEHSFSLLRERIR